MTVLILHSMRLYLPDDVLLDRVGSDVEPFSQYIKALQRAAMHIWKAATKRSAKGLLVAIGMRPDGSTRVWADAIDGEVPADTLAQLCTALGNVPAIPIKNGPVAFAMELGIDGNKPKDFPVIPQAWMNAKQATNQPLSIPDQLFNVVWPASSQDPSIGPLDDRS